MDIRERPVETNLYYLTSCYYNPEWGRFIQSDTLDYIEPSSINGINLYCYCLNDPINCYDPSGHSPTVWWEWALAGVVVAGLIVGAVFTGGTLVGAVLAGAIGAASGYIGGAGARNKAAINQGKGVQNATAKLNRVVQRIANGTKYKSLTTAQTAFTNAMNGLTSAIQSQMGHMFAIAMVSYGISTAAFTAIDAWFNASGYWLF